MGKAKVETIRELQEECATGSLYSLIWQDLAELQLGKHGAKSSQDTVSYFS